MAISVLNFFPREGSHGVRQDHIVADRQQATKGGMRIETRIQQPARMCLCQLHSELINVRKGFQSSIWEKVPLLKHPGCGSLLSDNGVQMSDIENVPRPHVRCQPTLKKLMVNVSKKTCLQQSSYASERQCVSPRFLFISPGERGINRIRLLLGQDKAALGVAHPSPVKFSQSDITLNGRKQKTKKDLYSWIMLASEEPWFAVKNHFLVKFTAVMHPQKLYLLRISFFRTLQQVFALLSQPGLLLLSRTLRDSV